MDTPTTDRKPQKIESVPAVGEQETLAVSPSMAALPVIRRLRADTPTKLAPHEVLALQRTVGNQAVRQMLADRALQRRVANPADLPEGPLDAVQQHRSLDFITVKIMGRGVDHWWIELNSTESYGWWPVREPEDAGDAAWNHGIVGVAGELNAISRPSMPGTPTRDPHHGETTPESFHPFTIDRSDTLSDQDILQRIRSFARGFRGDYRILGGPNCHTFISDLMQSVGLSMNRTTSPDPVLP